MNVLFERLLTAASDLLGESSSIAKAVLRDPKVLPIFLYSFLYAEKEKF